jgi:glucose/arabinose dehydrogenase/PKD repeat protein
VVVAALVPAAGATPLQPGFTESTVFSGLTEPTDVAFAPDGRVFVSEKSGLIKVFSSLNATTPTIAVDLRTQVYNFWDRGLLSIALDPQFPTRPYLYALYTADAEIGGVAPKWGTAGETSDGCPTPPGATDLGCTASTRLAKLTVTGDIVTSEQVLINDWCQQFPSHSAGGLVFGPDGMLYASGGEGASFNFTDYGQEKNVCGDPPAGIGGTQTAPTAEGGALRAQDYRTTADPTGLDGSLIRVDPDTGAAAPGNPNSASSDLNQRRIIAAGMRNPFRFTFRPGTSEIYVGDVGWGTWEEINRLPKADDSTVDNFGWPCYEGPNQSPAYAGAGLNLCKSLYNTPGSTTAPLYAYEHGADVVKGEECTEGGSSVSGLAFYEGGSYPSNYKGALFFADYSRRCTWVMFEKNGLPDPSTRISFMNDNDPVNIKIGPGGDLFVVDFTGSVRRISYPGGNRAPTAVAKAQPQYGPLPLTVSFDGTGSTDPDAGDTLTYAWDLDGDGQYDDSTAAKPSWTYTSAATVTARLKVSDKGGLSSATTITIGAGNEPPHAVIDTPTEALHWAVGDPISFSGHGSDPQDGTLPAANMSWNLVMRHCETVNDCHSHSLQSYPGVTGGSFVAPDHEYPSYLELRLTVTDKGGLSDTQVLRLDPRTVDLNFASEPPGLTLSVGDTSGAAPFTKTVIVGSHQTITAGTPQLLNNAWYGFSFWSDLGAPTHDIVAPEATATYTAKYKAEPVAPGLVLAYGFEETSGITANDSSPAKNNGTLVNGPISTASGKFGRALSFDGVNDRVDVPDSNSLDLTTGMTLEAWVKPTTISGWRTAILKERGTTDLNYALYASNGSKPRIENYTGVETGTNGLAGLPLNAWTHLAATYDGANLRLYVNGALVATKPATGAMPNTANPLRIGGNAIWGEYFSGLIDEVRVYNRALNETEVKADMQAAVGSGGTSTDGEPPSPPGNLKATGAIGKVTLNWEASTDNVGVTGYEVYRSTTSGFTPSAANRIGTPSGTSFTDPVAAGTYYYRVKAADATGNLSNASAEASGVSTADKPPTVSVASPTGGTVSGAVTLKATASDDVGVSGVQFLVDGSAVGSEDTSSPYEVQWSSTSVPNGTHKITARAKDTAGNTTTSSEVSVTVSNTTTSNGLVLAYGFEETSGITANDSSPAKNNGTLVNGPISTASGKFGRALSFDGVNDRVDVPDSNSLDLTTGMTLEAWVKPTTISGWRTAILKERGSDLNYALYASNGTKPRTENYTGTENAATGTAGIPLNAWTHLASTYDGTNLKLYVNGTLATTKATTGAMPNTANPLHIGGNAVWGEYFSGLIDEVRIYNRALNEAEVKTDMNTAVGP